MSERPRKHQMTNYKALPGLRRRFGIRDGDKGTHPSRILMLAKIEKLLDATEADALFADYRQAVIKENVLGKRTHTTREHTTWKLKALFGLDPEIPVFQVMRRF